MTLIIGVKCSNGIVIGADSAVVQGNIRYTTDKIKKISESVVIGTAGFLDLSQKVEEIFKLKYLEGKLSNLNPHTAIEEINNAFYQAVRNDWTIAIEAIKCFGQANNLIFQGLTALSVQNNLRLYNTWYECRTYEITTSNPIITIGSGSTNADSFLTFIHRVLLNKKVPTITDGVFLTLWALQHAILISAGDVCGPPKILTMENKDDAIKTIEMCEDDFKETYDFIKEVELYICDYFINRNSSKANPIPKLK